MNRRRFLSYGLSGAAGATWLTIRPPRQQFVCHPPAYGVIPVVGDGKWIWTEPPKDQTGYLEPRQYDVSIGMRFRGKGSARSLLATTAVPVAIPEQEIQNVRIETQGSMAKIRQVAPEAGQLMMAAPSIVAGQTVSAVAHFRLTLYKTYHGYQKEQFTAQQDLPTAFRNLYLRDSPGIQTRRTAVRKLAAKVGGQIKHPWDKAKAFYEWVWSNIHPRPGYYTSVVEAIRDRVGDCEERAAVFVALCRASEIPARLVWVPNHNWAEFYLKDHQGEGHWIPAHTSAYSWFGWTGAHEMVLQKGDSIRVPEKSKPLRLMADWMRCQGRRPQVRYYGEVKPIAAETGGEPGPGARSKDEKGEWIRVRNHPLDTYARR